MFRPQTDTWVRSARTTACIVTLLALTGLALATATPVPAAPTWRAFAQSSPWNVPAAPQSIGSSNPYASQFARSSGFTMKLSGTPDNPRYSSPIFFAQPGDPVAGVKVGQPSWAPRGNTKWNGQPVPVPSGVTPASGSDGHLTVVSADRRTAWEFWRCTAAGTGGYKTEVIVQWDLAGPGYASVRGDNSARGSGTPLISTTLRADEALNGVNHVLGITVPSVASDYLYPPASHSDGGGGGGIKYGMLFVLRPDYAPPPGSGVGERNVIQALKTYGAYVIDQGADFEMDADFTHPEIWAQTGLNQNSFDFTGADFRPASAGPVPPAGPPTGAQGNGGKKHKKHRKHRKGKRHAKVKKHTKKHKKKAKKRHVALRADAGRIVLGQTLHLSGNVITTVPGGARLRIQVRTRHGQWRRLRHQPLNADRTFGASAQFLRSAGASSQELRIDQLRLSRHTRLILIRAVIARAGKSNVVRVRLVPHA
jgi:hypothetical protein